MRLSIILRSSSSNSGPSSLAAAAATHDAMQPPLVERFVPRHRQPTIEYIRRIDQLLATKPRVLCLTGAGISTESGIPDYRSEGVGMYARSANHQPAQHQQFVLSAAVRQRYWARNFIAWPRFSAFQPNATHEALARFERAGHLSGLITQNVDQLHRKAGSANLLELHGHGGSVVCVGRIDRSTGRRVTTACDYRVDRAELQLELHRLNVSRLRNAEVPETALRPDGDVDVPAEFMESFEVPECPKCGGNLKTDVVFFGDNVPKQRVEQIDRWLEHSDALLVLGSSLQVLSGYRIAAQAHERGLPVVIVNIGPTRADPMATMKLAAKCGDVVPLLFGGTQSPANAD